MKRIAVFIGLKIVEISSVVFIPYWVGVWDPLKFGGTVPWIVGIATLFVAALGCLIAGGLIAANWEWAKKLTK